MPPWRENGPTTVVYLLATGFGAGCGGQVEEQAVEEFVENGGQHGLPSVPISDDYPTWSGTRLELRAFDAESGASGPGAIFDTQLEQRCTFRRVENEVWACLPSVDAALVYADPSCTTLILLASAAEKSEWIAKNSAEDCAAFGSFEYFKRGEPLSVQPTEYYFDWGSGCTPHLDPDFNVPMAFYSVEAVASPMLVEGRLVTEEGEARLRRQFYEGADGSRSFAGLFDAEQEVACELAIAPNLKGPCTPETWSSLDSGEVGRFSDLECEQKLLSVSRDACDAPADGVVLALRDWSGPRPAFEQEQREYAFFRLGHEHEGPYFDGLECEKKPPLPADASYSYYSLGEELPQHAVPWTEHRLFGSGRILLEDAANAEGKRLFSYFRQFYDTSLGEACELKEQCDGATLCVPSSKDRWIEWADSDCTMPLGTLKGEVVHMERECGGQLYRVTDKAHEGPVYSSRYEGLNERVCYDGKSWGDGFITRYTLEETDEHPFAEISERVLKK